MVTPIVTIFTGVKDFVTDLGQRFVNMYIYKSFSSNEELVEQFYEKVDTIVNFYPEISREDILGVVYYTDIDPEDYLDSLDKDFNIEDEQNSYNDDKINFIRMRNKVLSLSNQMVYSTVTFRNDLVREEIEEEVDKDENDNATEDDKNKEKKEKKKDKNKETKEKQKEKKKKVTYHCPVGTTEFTSDLKNFCENGVSIYKGGSPNLETADECIDMTTELTDEEAPKNMKCFQITFEANTQKSKTKLENFLRYGIVADTILPEVSILEGYSWGNMVSKFSSLSSFSDSTLYNIPAYKIGKGKEIDNYTDLNDKDKRTVDNKIRVIMGLINIAKEDKEKNTHHIKGDATLPLDFTIKGTAEETIKSRITSYFGNRMHPVYHEIRFHNGVDFSHITTADPVYSLLDGVVVGTTNVYSGCGIGVLIGHDIDNDLKYDYYTRYCHFSSLKL